MTGWYAGDHITGWGWFGMTLSAVLFVALLMGAGMFLIRYARRAESAGVPPSPERLLAERFARGEPTEGQYCEQLSTLRDTGAPRH